MKDKNLAILIKYYKEGKVTEFTLCSEIEDYVSTTLRTQVEIAKGVGTSSYIVALLPIKTESGYKVRYIIDKGALDSNFITDEDIVSCIENIKENEQQILMAFHKELAVMKYNEVGLSELLASYLKIFRMGQSCLPYTVKEKAVKNKMMDPASVDNYIEKLESYSERLPVIIEELGVKNVVPPQFIDAARKLVDYQVERRIVVGDPGVPNINQLNTVLGHDRAVDDIFSGGVEIKEPIMESEDLKKKLKNKKLAEEYGGIGAIEMSENDYNESKSSIKEKLASAGKCILKVLKAAGNVILILGMLGGSAAAAVAYGTKKGLEDQRY